MGRGRKRLRRRRSGNRRAMDYKALRKRRFEEAVRTAERAYEEEMLMAESHFVQRLANEYRETLEMLRQDERVRSTEYVYPGTLHLETNQLQAECDGHLLSVGRVRLVLRKKFVERNTLGIEWLTVRPLMYATSDGYFCFGLLGNDIMKRIWADEYLPAVYMMLQALEHINEADRKAALKHYTHVEDCPGCGQKKGVGKWLTSLVTG